MDILTHSPTTHHVKLCVVVQHSSNQQHNTDKSYETKIEFSQNKFPTQFFFQTTFVLPNKMSDQLFFIYKNEEEEKIN